MAVFLLLTTAIECSAITSPASTKKHFRTANNHFRSTFGIGGQLPKGSLEVVITTLNVVLATSLTTNYRVRATLWSLGGDCRESETVACECEMSLGLICVPSVWQRLW